MARLGRTELSFCAAFLIAGLISESNGALLQGNLYPVLHLLD